MNEEEMENMTITPIVPFDKSLVVPGLTDEQFISFNEMKDTEVSEETGNYLITLNYARKVG